MRGGYKIVNFKFAPLTLGGSVQFPGIYEAIEGSFKAFLLENIAFVDSNGTNVEIPATFANFSKVGTDFKTIVQTVIDGTDKTLDAYEITVSDGDAVALTHITQTFA